MKTDDDKIIFGPKGKFEADFETLSTFIKTEPMTIYINGLSFEVDRTKMNVRQLCKLIQIPFDNSEASFDAKGLDIPFTGAIHMNEGLHIKITRKRVIGS